MMRDIVREALESEGDMVVRVVEEDSESLLPVLESGAADAIIAGSMTPDEPELPLQLLTRVPGAKILMLDRNAHRAILCEFRRTPILEVSPRRLIAAIR